jgi:hypothetical protein
MIDNSLGFEQKIHIFLNLKKNYVLGSGVSLPKLREPQSRI